MNKQHTIFIIGLISLSAIIIPYTIFFMGSIEEGSENSEAISEDNNLDEIEKTIPNLQNQIRYISNIEYIKGENASIDDLTKLNSSDEDYYAVKGTYSTGIGYEFDIRFYFELDDPNLDLYDLFLNFQTDFSSTSEKVSFLANQSFAWNNIVNISLSEIQIDKLYLEQCYGFRINGTTTLQKTIKIDALYIILANGGHFDNRLTAMINGTIQVASQSNHGYSKPAWIDEGWWLDVDDSAELHSGQATQGSSYVWTKRDYHLILDAIGEIEQIVSINQLNFSVHYEESYSGSDEYVAQMLLWDNFLGDWNGALTQSFGTSMGSGIYTTFDWADYSQVQNFPEFYVDNDAKAVLFRIYLLSGNVLYPDYLYSMFLELWASETEIIYDADLSNTTLYPKINDIYTIPDSEISPIGDPQFRIYCQTEDIYRESNAWNNGINNVQYLIVNNSGGHTGWDYLEYDSNNLYSKQLNTADFENGNYTCWIRTEDNNGLYTYDYYDFSIQNARPRISIITPSFLEEITQLYNYNVNISIFEPEGEEYWIFGNPEILIYQENESQPILNWTEMERYNPFLPQYWNYSFNPVDYDNGIYKIKLRVRDSIDYGYNDTMININNNPPKIEIISPSLTELQIPFTQTIECNISNEEPINTAQWDLVKTLENYDWKSLSYNISTGYYESSFSLLDYQYGDYFLVINATDDKYNSTIKTKQLKLHPLLTYNIGIPQITYKNKGIIIYTNPDDTTDITAQFNIEHHPIAQERDFEIYIPEDYEDAFDYYINRGFNTYEPTGFTNEGVYTLWYIPDYLPTDIVHFQLEKPKLTNDISGVLEKEDGSYELVFTLTAKHSFTALTIKHSLTQYFAHPENYEYILEYKYEGDWKEYNGDLEVDAGAFINFEFSWASIDSNSTLEFRFSAIPLEIEESNLTAWLIFGGVASAIGAVVWVLFGGFAFKKYVDWGKGKFILVSIAVIGISFGIGFGIGFLAYPNPV